MPSIEPSPEKLQKLVAEANDQSPVVMINLLRYRERAEYPRGSDATPCSGAEAYQRYGALVVPMLAEVGAKILWRGSVKQTVIGPESEEWDEALLVQYPSRKAFLTMVGRADYQRAAVHRSAALADSRLIATGAPASGF
ncbi:MAG TPA: DUF1330 domain-containing protein [Candidatus Binatia bacterium]|nr:DUF1330 domain-containing protein [Candidatus Binatia bacterium]